jgi:integrase
VCTREPFGSRASTQGDVASTRDSGAPRSARSIGEPWLPASFSTGWRRFAAAHGFSGIGFHTLRHGHATLLLAGGVSDAVAIKLMGHADSKILRRYQEVVDELQRDAATRMDRLLGG